MFCRPSLYYRIWWRRPCVQALLRLKWQQQLLTYKWMIVNNKHWGVVLFVHNLNNCVKYPNKKTSKTDFISTHICSCMCACVSACAGGRRRVGWGIQVKTNSWRFQMTPPPLLGRSTTQQYNNRLRVLYQVFHSEALNAMVLRQLIHYLFVPSCAAELCMLLPCSSPLPDPITPQRGSNCSRESENARLEIIFKKQRPTMQLSWSWMDGATSSLSCWFQQAGKRCAKVSITSPTHPLPSKS